jgi:hypothetical protein
MAVCRREIFFLPEQAAALRSKIRSGIDIHAWRQDNRDTFVFEVRSNSRCDKRWRGPLGIPHLAGRHECRKTIMDDLITLLTYLGLLITPAVFAATSGACELETREDPEEPSTDDGRG